MGGSGMAETGLAADGVICRIVVIAILDPDRAVSHQK